VSARLISAIKIYPLKSAAGQELKKIHISSQGPDGDRRWMLIDAEGKFLSQRTLPKMATLQTHFNDQGLTVGFNNQFFRVPITAPKRFVSVQIWDDRVEAALEPDLYSQTLSQYLGVPCRLVRYTETSARKLPATESWQAGVQPEVRFADSRPLLLVNTASLDDLNGRLSQPIGIDRFRANLVFNGQEAFEEECWKKIRIGNVTFSQPKKCSRCPMINNDQVTGDSPSKEPLKVLSTYRRDGNKVIFGVLWIPENAGTIALQDPLEILE